MVSNTGIITKPVRKSASATTTWFGGMPCVPTAWRRNDSTITMRTKPVSVTRIAGASETSVSSAAISSGPPTSLPPICTETLGISLARRRAPLGIRGAARRAQPGDQRHAIAGDAQQQSLAVDLDQRHELLRAEVAARDDADGVG